MSAHDLTVAGYALIALIGVSLELVARAGGTAIPALSTVLSRITRGRAGRVAVMAGWAWLGLHFFAR
jgi:hypothetical protein